MIQKSLIEFFILEAEEHIQRIEAGVAHLEKTPANIEEIDEISRAAHTLKGAAALLKLRSISETAYLLENTFKEVKNKRLPLNHALVLWVMKGTDTIKTLIRSIKDGKGEDASLVGLFRSSSPFPLDAPVGRKREPLSQDGMNMMPMPGENDTKAVPCPEQHHPLPSAGKRKTILVVDDSITVREFIVSILATRNYRTLAAINGHEALNAIDKIHVDMIITDLEMPVMNGFELLSELKRRGLLTTVPVIVVTSRDGEKYRQKAISLGASHFMVKPFEEEMLLKAVGRTLC